MAKASKKATKKKATSTKKVISKPSDVDVARINMIKFFENNPQLEIRSYLFAKLPKSDLANLVKIMKKLNSF